MSALGLSIEYRIGNESGPDAMQRLGVAFERAGAELVDMGRHVFPLLPPVFEAAEARQFDAEGAGPVAGAWLPLSAVYAAWKAKKYPGQPILVATGSLRAALTTPNSPLGARDWSASSFVFGTTSVPYASIHQTGGTSYVDGVRVHIPPRPPFDFDEAFEKDLRKAARAGVAEAIRESGLDTFVGTIPEHG